MKSAQQVHLEAEGLNPRPIIFDGFSAKANYNFYWQVCSTLMRGLKEGKENLNVLFAQDGESAYFVVEGEDYGVQVPSMIMKWVSIAEPHSLVMIHNHPSSGSFSHDDLKLFFSCPAWYLWLIVGHDGTVYYLKKLKKVHKYDADLIVNDFAANLDYLHIKYECAVQLSKHTEKTASAEHTHEAVLLTQKEYPFVYGRVKRDSNNLHGPYEVPEAPRMAFKDENYPTLYTMWNNHESSNAKYYDLFMDGHYDEKSYDEEYEEDIIENEEANDQVTTSKFDYALLGSSVANSSLEIRNREEKEASQELIQVKEIKSNGDFKVLNHEGVIKDRLAHLAIDNALISNGYKREDFSRLSNDEEDTEEDYKYYKKYQDYCDSIDPFINIDFSSSEEFNEIINYFENRKPSKLLSASCDTSSHSGSNKERNNPIDEREEQKHPKQWRRNRPFRSFNIRRAKKIRIANMR